MPMVKKTYSITETLDQHVKAKIQSGEYATDSEYLRELIRRDQEEQKEIAYVRSKLKRAEKNGFTNKRRDQILIEIKERARINGDL